MFFQSHDYSNNCGLPSPPFIFIVLGQLPLEIVVLIISMQTTSRHVAFMEDCSKESSDLKPYITPESRQGRRNPGSSSSSNNSSKSKSAVDDSSVPTSGMVMQEFQFPENFGDLDATIDFLDLSRCLLRGVSSLSTSMTKQVLTCRTVFESINDYLRMCF